MGRFSERIVSRQTVPARTAVTETNAFRARTVHAGSLADEAGLKEGMFYLPSQMVASPLLLKDRGSAKTVMSRFVDAAAGEEIELVTQGFPFGVELVKSPAAIAQDCLNDYVDIDGLAVMAHAGNEQDVERFVSLIAAHQSKANRDIGAVLKGWFGGKATAADSRALTLDAGNYMGVTPHAKLLGAIWLAANRQAPGARSLLAAWEHWGVESSGGSWSALYYLVQALIKEAEGAAGADVQGLLREAHLRAPDSTLIADIWGPRTSQPLPVVATLKGRAFPLDYRLPARDPLEAAPKALPQFVAFRDVIEALGESERLLIICLGGYRANGFYERITNTLAALAPLIGPFYKAVHVITAYQPGGRHNPVWMTGEIACRKAGAPIQILHDESDQVSTVLKTTRSPHAFVVDRAGVVRYDGWMTDEGGLWAGIAP